MKYWDPTGEEWETKDDENIASLIINNLNESKRIYETEFNTLFKKSQKGNAIEEDFKRVGELGDMINDVTSSINELEIMGDDRTNQVFHFNKTDDPNFEGGGTLEKRGDGVIQMNVSEHSGIAMKVHEAAHGYQMCMGEISESGGLRKISTELVAYQRQFSSDLDYDNNDILRNGFNMCERPESRSDIDLPYVRRMESLKSLKK